MRTIRTKDKDENSVSFLTLLTFPPQTSSISPPSLFLKVHPWHEDRNENNTKQRQEGKQRLFLKAPHFSSERLHPSISLSLCVSLCVSGGREKDRGGGQGLKLDSSSSKDLTSLLSVSFPSSFLSFLCQEQHKNRSVNRDEDDTEGGNGCPPSDFSLSLSSSSFSFSFSLLPSVSEWRESGRNRERRIEG